jgi:hypothetical protein
LSAVVSKPCPADCGTIANAFTQLRRTGDGGALSQKLRPRPPTVAPHALYSSGIAKSSSVRRRLSPPRAPPAPTPHRLNLTA